jgi:hypothetical protein
LTKSGATAPLDVNHQLVRLASDLLETSWGEGFRSKSSDFTRGGSLTPEVLLTLMLFMAGDAGRRGYEHVLEDFWAEAQRSGISLPCDDPVTAAAFCKARKKLKPELFATLLSKVGALLADKDEDWLRWRGRRFYAVDGMCHNTQRSAALADAFGVPSGSHCPQILVSTLFDVVGKFPVAATIAPSASCERQELLKLLDHLQAGDVLVLDRGYPSHEVLQSLCARGIEFIIRVPKSHSFAAIDEFQERSQIDGRVTINPSPRDARAGVQPLKLRMVRIDVNAGDPWILLTSLPRSEATRFVMGQAYHLRWEIEELYKTAKSDYFTQRQFHAKSPEGVEQEVRCQLLMVAIARLLMTNAAVATETPYQHLKTKSGILAVVTGIVRILLCDDPEKRLDHHASMLTRIARRPVKRRLGRSCPRRSFKPGPRWNSKGKGEG